MPLTQATQFRLRVPEQMLDAAAGFIVETVQYKNVLFTVWDAAAKEKLLPLWRYYATYAEGVIEAQSA